MSVKAFKFPRLHARMIVKSGDHRVIKRYVNAVRNLLHEQGRILPRGSTAPMSNLAWHRILKDLKRNYK